MPDRHIQMWAVPTFKIVVTNSSFDNMLPPFRGKGSNIMVLRQRLTVMGWVGLVFFFQGPLLYWFKFLSGLIGVSFGGVLPILVSCMMVAMSVFSLPMLLLGREWVIIKE